MASSASSSTDRPNLASIVEDFRRHGEQIAIVSRQGLRRHALSYRGLADLAARFAAELDARAIHKGERVLIWGDNDAAWIAAFFGCILRGAIAVPIDVAGSATFAQRVARDVAPKLIAGNREQLRLLDPASHPQIAFEDFERVLPLVPAYTPVEGLSEADAVQIVFTSGTTGEPKGIVHTHGNVLASLRPIEREVRKYLKYERPFHPIRFLHTLPLSHVFGQFMGIWIPSLLAAEVHFESHLAPANIVELIRQERISVLAAVPRVLEMLQSHFLDRLPGLGSRIASAGSLPAWRRWWVFRDVHRALGFKFWALICGGATLPEHIEQFWGRVGLVVVQGYGMTETTALVSLNHPFHPAPGSIGKVLPGREIRLGDDGEILVRGATVSNATWEAGRLQPGRSDWLATGDLGSVDESGNLKFRGRKKELIVTASGLNIYPDDLEAALLRQPQIKAAAVVEAVGATGSEPLAALVLHGSADPATAVRAANRELAGYQQIRRWTIWPDPDFPRTSTGKILRREVAAALRSARRQDGDNTQPVVTAGSGMLATLIGRVTRENIQGLADSAALSEDLHLDSLGRVELQSVLEAELGIQIDAAAYQQAQTLGDLRELLTRSTPAGSGSSSADAGLNADSHDEHVYPVWPWTHLSRALRVVFIETVMRSLVALIGKPHVLRDLDANLSAPTLIVANHVTAFDVPLILYALSGNMRRRVAVAMAGKMLLDWRHGRGQSNFLFNLVAPIQYLLVTGLFNVFPLPQSGDFRKSFAHAGRAMDAGFHVLVFPEGRRTPDGVMHPFQGGAGLLWKELRVPALPIHLGGFSSDRVSIRIGKPIPFSADLEAADAARILERAVRQLREDEFPAASQQDPSGF